MRLTKIHLYLLCLLLLLAVLMSMSASAAPGDPPAVGDWFITEQIEYKGKIGYVDGSIIIGPSGQLQLENSVLVVKKDVFVDSHANLAIRNSTIKLDCSPIYDSTIIVRRLGSVSILDGDGNPDTEYDRSVITSNNSLSYNFTVDGNATFLMENSLIDMCGKYSDDGDMTEGLHVKAGNTMILHTQFTRGYYGLILDQARGIRVENCTFDSNSIGILLRGAQDTVVQNCVFTDNSIYNAQMRGLLSNVRFTENILEGTTGTNLVIMASSGMGNEISKNTIGPGATVGAFTQNTRGYFFSKNTIEGCFMGWDMDLLDADLELNTVINCTVGIMARAGGRVAIMDLNLFNTTITVDPIVDFNITVVETSRWEDVVADIASPIYVKEEATLELVGVDLSFRDSGGDVNGIEAVHQSSLTVHDSTISSRDDGHWTCIMDTGSKADISNSAFEDLGVPDLGVRKQGFFIGASGQIEGLTISNSLTGLVIGRVQASIKDVTIEDCTIGILFDGDLGLGVTEIYDVTIAGCEEAARGVNEGVLAIIGGSIEPAGDGFNLTSASLQIRDMEVASPQTGRWTCRLDESSNLEVINSSLTERFLFQRGENAVNFHWYLNLTLRFLSDGSPLSDALVSVREVSGGLVVRDRNAGIDGYLEETVLRHRSLTPDETITTPHTVSVVRGNLRDSFTIEMDHNKDHTYYIDNYPPVLSIFSPLPDSISNVSTVTVSGEAMDARVTETEGLESLEYRLDNGTWLPIELPAVKDWSFDLVVEDGVHLLTVRVVDRIGNRATETVMFEVDTKPPILSILSPTGDVYTQEPSILIIGKSEPGAIVMVGGTSVDLSVGGDFNITLELEEGVNDIEVVAIDANGNRRTITVRAVLDTTPPVVELNLPSGEWWTSSDQVVIEGSKEANTTIVVDTERPEFFADTFFSVTVTLEEGVNSFAVIGEDLAGNTWSTTVLIHRDTAAPSLTVQDLPSHTNSPTMTVSGSTDDPTAIITVNGQVVALTGNAFAASVSLVEGPNTIVVTARDPLDNEAAPVTLEVVLDTVLPTLSITTKDYVKTVKDKQNLSGTTEPGLTVVVSVTFGGAYSKTYDVVAGDDGAFSVEVRLPQVGNHSVKVTVDDRAGNRAQKDLSFERVSGSTSGPTTSDGPSWFDEHWEWVVLAVSIVASILVVAITVMPTKKKVVRRTAPSPVDEGLPEADEGAEEQWEEEEVAEEEWQEA